MDTARKRKLTRPKEEEAKEEKLLALTTKAGRGGWLVLRDTRVRAGESRKKVRCGVGSYPEGCYWL